MEYTEEEKKVIKDLKEEIKGAEYEGREKNRIVLELKALLNLLEKQQKEIEEKDKQIDRLSLVRQEVSYGYDNTSLITNEKLAIIERNTYKIEVEEGVFVDIRKLYDDYKDSIPKEAIKEKMKQLEITDCTIRYDKYDIQDILKELLGE